MKSGINRAEDWAVERYLMKAGFKVFSSDGTYFVDSRGKQYGAWADLATVEDKIRENGGERHYIAIRGVRRVKPEEDVFQLLYDESGTGGLFRNEEDVTFLDRIPCPTYYNTAVVSPIARWAESGWDGSSEKSLYSVLMLKSRVERKQEFHKDPTPEEIRLREIELSQDPF